MKTPPSQRSFARTWSVAFAIAVYLEWVVIIITKHFDDLFQYGALHYPLSSQQGIVALFAFGVLFVTLARNIHIRRDALPVALMALPAMAFNSYFGVGALLS
jgi:hypothetical protein